MKTIFEETKLGDLKLKNRLIRSATWEGLADENGHLPEQLYTIYEELARGGVGMIVSGFTSVSDIDRYFGGIARVSNDELIPEHKRLAETVHQYQCPFIAQLALGEYAKIENERIFRDIAIDDLTTEDIKDIIVLFTAGAKRAETAGYDGAQIHAAHGFFLSRFISPYYNHRKDDYGKDKGKIIVDILKSIKDNCPDLHVSMKINSSDFVYGGLDENDSMKICLACAENGIDSIEVSGNGTSVPGIKAGKNEAYFKDFALELARNISVPVILVGGHRSVENIEKVLNEGNVEFISLSRPLVREPDLPKRWASGETSPAKCVSCNMCYRTQGHQCVFNLRK
ncbi:MAG: NADH:flavin oxidoreductase [Clostridia bacterium]|nr:NADH:flavin oxidoreductase [Clostridia bacterium]